MMDEVKKLRLFKIRDRLTGLYSPGGQRVKTEHFVKKGKIWQGTGPLRGHLNQYGKIPSSWEVVECEITETGKTYSANDFR